MALRSMTGFGSANGEVQGIRVMVEVRSVNHKGLDIKMAVTGTLSSLEPHLLRQLRGRLTRGRVHLRVSRDGGPAGTSGATPVFDLNAAANLMTQLQALRQAAGLEDPIKLEHLLSMPGLVVRDAEATLDLQKAWPEVEALVGQALTELISERDREGQALADDMLGRLDKIGQQVTRIEAELPVWRQERLQRLKTRVEEMIETLQAEAISSERLAQEMILLCERTDITEELTRARAHLVALVDLIQGHDPQSDGPVGKKLDFYFQELIRETNTMGSKSQSEVIAGCVVDMRSEIDRLREQVLNVA